MKQKTAMQTLVDRVTDVQEKAETIDKDRADAYYWVLQYIQEQHLLTIERDQIEEAYNEDLYGGLSGNQKFNDGADYYQQKYES